MKISEILEESVAILEKNKIENCKEKSRRLLASVLDKEKEYLMIHENEEIDERIYLLYKKKLERLANGEPLQYILNHQEFMKYDFYVDKNVLIPQPDTENLVEEVINIVNSFDRYEIKAPKILDLCTGSGAIAVSLAKILSNSLIYASDISENALKIAEINADNNEANVLFIKSDLFKNIFEEYKFDVIVSNPPYIETETIKTLSKEVQNEPILALDGGVDGLNFYREIAEKAKDYLNDDGYLAFEIGYNQKEKVEEILKLNEYKNIYSRKDLSGNDRIVVAQK